MRALLFLSQYWIIWHPTTWRHFVLFFSMMGWGGVGQGLIWFNNIPCSNFRTWCYVVISWCKWCEAITCSCTWCYAVASPSCCTWCCVVSSLSIWRYVVTFSSTWRCVVTSSSSWCYAVTSPSSCTWCYVVICSCTWWCVVTSSCTWSFLWLISPTQLCKPCDRGGQTRVICQQNWEAMRRVAQPMREQNTEYLG